MPSAASVSNIVFATPACSLIPIPITDIFATPMVRKRLLSLLPELTSSFVKSMSRVTSLDDAGRSVEFLIFDEATSSLDSLSEMQVQQAIDDASADRTVIIIAHRLSTIRDATRIVVLDSGRVAAKGTHDDLMASNALYREMCARLAIRRPPSEGATVDTLHPDHSTS